MILQHQHLRQMKMYISLFLFHLLERVSPYSISSMQWKIKRQKKIIIRYLPRVNEKNIKSS